MAVWLTHDQSALDRSASPAYRTEYVEDRFEQYYSDQPSVVFFTQVTTNNIRVSFMAFALGLFGMIPGHRRSSPTTASPSDKRRPG